MTRETERNKNLLLTDRKREYYFCKKIQNEKKKTTYTRVNEMSVLVKKKKKNKIKY